VPRQSGGDARRPGLTAGQAIESICFHPKQRVTGDLMATLETVILSAMHQHMAHLWHYHQA
jgi:hypothetical protein